MLIFPAVSRPLCVQRPRHAAVPARRRSQRAGLRAASGVFRSATNAYAWPSARVLHRLRRAPPGFLHVPRRRIRMPQRLRKTPPASRCGSAVPAVRAPPTGCRCIRPAVREIRPIAGWKARDRRARAPGQASDDAAFDDAPCLVDFARLRQARAGDERAAVGNDGPCVTLCPETHCLSSATNPACSKW